MTAIGWSGDWASRRIRTSPAPYSSPPVSVTTIDSIAHSLRETRTGRLAPEPGRGDEQSIGSFELGCHCPPLVSLGKTCSARSVVKPILGTSDVLCTLALY